MGTDLILQGTVTVATIDVSAEVTGVIIKGTTADIVVPATMSTPVSHLGGAQKYEITIDYLSDDASTGTLFPILWTAIGTASREVAFTARLHPGAVGVGNPQWGGTFVVSGAEVGGQVESLSAGSMTCVMTGAPTVATS